MSILVCSCTILSDVFNFNFNFHFFFISFLLLLQFSTFIFKHVFPIYFLNEFSFWTFFRSLFCCLRQIEWESAASTEILQAMWSIGLELKMDKKWRKYGNFLNEKYAKRVKKQYAKWRNYGFKRESKAGRTRNEKLRLHCNELSNDFIHFVSQEIIRELEPFYL